MALIKHISVSKPLDRKIVRFMEEESERERRPFSQTVFRYLERVPELRDQIAREEALEEVKA